MATKEQEKTVETLQCLSARVEEGLCVCSLTEWLVEHDMEPDMAERMLTYALTANPQAMARFLIQQALELFADRSLQGPEAETPTIH
jgi:hypothetical protein